MTVFDGPDRRTGFEAAALPAPRGPLSECVLAALRDEAPPRDPPPVLEPYGEDAQLTLYCLYELHYRGFAGVDAEREWDPDLLRVRRALERAFLAALRADVPPATTSSGRSPGCSPSRSTPRAPACRTTCSARRSLAAARVPRAPLALPPQGSRSAGLGDPATARGRPRRRWSPSSTTSTARATRSACTRGCSPAMMDALGLDDRYGAYLDAAPAATLAEVNLMSLCGLHRAVRGALVGQFATVELTSSPGSDRLVRAMHRLGLHADGVGVLRRAHRGRRRARAAHAPRCARPAAGRRAQLADDVVFGIRASTLLADRFDDQLLTAWSNPRTSLRHALSMG